MTIKNAKQCLREEVIPALRERSPYSDVTSIRHLLTEKDAHVERETLNRYMSELTDAGFVFSAGRGWYSFLKIPFLLGTESLDDLTNKINHKFPLLDFACWSTQQINRFMHHLLAKFVQFVYTERDVMASVFDHLRDAGYDVYLNPTKREADKIFSIGEKTIVLRPTITKSPIQGHVAPIEKILVDLSIECKVLPLMDQSEFRGMCQNLVTSERVVMSELMSYARRRGVALNDLFENPQSTISTFARKWR
ncbi:MAG: hypothetical protein GQ544_07340 [Candidatus Aminicenantes bacterium]|nr:hypothetical protein [Candidatus Aminicenantes bacterium]